jgi:hypothetical protein
MPPVRLCVIIRHMSLLDLLRPSWGRVTPSRNSANVAERYPANRRVRGGIEFKSTMEYNVWLWLQWCLDNNPAFFSVKYEPERFHFRPNKWHCSSYVPDFKVITRKGMYYIEVKGFMDFFDRVKLTLMKRDYPYIKMRVFDRKRYQEMKKRAPQLHFE